VLGTTKGYTTHRLHRSVSILTHGGLRLAARRSRRDPAGRLQLSSFPFRANSCLAGDVRCASRREGSHPLPFRENSCLREVCLPGELRIRKGQGSGCPPSASRWPRLRGGLGAGAGVKVNKQTGWSVTALNQFVIEFRSGSIILDSACLEGRNNGDKQSCTTALIEAVCILQRRGKGLIQDQLS